MKHEVFRVIEDVAAVDFQHDRDFGRALHNRWRASPPFQKLRMQLPIYISDIISNNILRRYRLRLMVYATQFRFRLDIGPAFCVGSDQYFGLSDSGQKGFKERTYLVG
ncbi:hypothetical protein HYPSUDRAFT_66491 [Hypholoma sublateritium FD-334 SS-4]|uniref:Uncharacterized protein n=1 Tax=Hypholoma sublateritium (strain FD-334 SS-4) TaxID=945553 RepID=A0A0D2L7Y1_HYPSF|nr:hypothetical protein HYPSUDRAFT_66491 [Hypholoma sublateritium FD-334 SS-4]